MQARQIDANGLPVIELAGEVDLEHSPELRALLLAHAEVRTPALALDFTAVKYIDSSGLATLVEYVRCAHSFGGRFALLGLNGRLRTIFDLVRLGEILPIVGTLEEARAALLAPAA